MGNIGLAELMVVGLIGLLMLGGATLVAFLVLRSQKKPPGS
jgi:hypothetical protein